MWIISNSAFGSEAKKGLQFYEVCFHIIGFFHGQSRILG